MKGILFFQTHSNGTSCSRMAPYFGSLFFHLSSDIKCREHKLLSADHQYSFARYIISHVSGFLPDFSPQILTCFFIFPGINQSAGIHPVFNINRCILYDLIQTFIIKSVSLKCFCSVSVSTVIRFYQIIQRNPLSLITFQILLAHSV